MHPHPHITKRLHISGLTPAISSHDLSCRLATFGSVTALDGLGTLDALGQPRNFAFVTLETTQSQLSRCMNVLSGSTWKGAKLRIGNAKPDFRERIALEKMSMGAEETRPRKRRRLARGVHGRLAQDMSLVTPKNVHQRPQWRVTPLGRLIRPMRMRPARPLGLPLDVLKAQHPSKGKSKGRKKRARTTPPTRARRQTIDPLRWGSTHLSGVFLEGGQVSMPPALVAAPGEGSNDGGNGESTEMEADEEVEEILDISPSSAENNPNTHPRAEIPVTRAALSRSSSPPVPTTSADLAAETARALQLLNSMFDLGSDMEQAATATRASAEPYASQPSHDTTDFEVVPASKPAHKGPSLDRQAEAEVGTAPRKPDLMQPSANLKDLFAPREEEGFSLIGHLNLESDLDLDLDLGEPTLANNAPAPASIPTSDPTATNYSAAPTPAATKGSKALDSTLPLFFPNCSNTKGRTRRVNFGRTDDEAQIRARWEAARGELTREWKRRHREAVKSRRRRGGGERVE
ncbi:hypothetical protein BC826DRAFT_1026167 [Russula brevipes]|nr:hypothetical protein BC826DRAFT_1026167 [Russula brevipes]